MSRPLILRGGRVVDPVTGIDTIMDLAIVDGHIAPVSEALGGTECDVSGLVLAPGLIDLHVHLRDPGQTHKEDLVSGTRAAAAGGFATIVAMPNTSPPIDSPARIQALRERWPAEASVRVLQTAALTVGRAGEALTSAAALAAAGAAALTDDGNWVVGSALKRAGLRAARDAGLAVLSHCEDPDLARAGVITDGDLAVALGLPTRPGVSEDLAVARDIILARETGCPVHIQHISTAEAVASVRQAQRRNIQVTAEVTPHHLLLTDAAVAEHGTNAKMNPPLRSEADRRAVVDALVDGTICAVATDHAPHTAAEKAKSMQNAPAGIVGLETVVGICLTELVHTKRMTLYDCVSRFTVGPRRVLGLPLHGLEPGASADLTIIDVNRDWTVDTAAFRSKSRNCPYHGRTLRGRPVATIVAGRVVYSGLAELEAGE